MYRCITHSVAYGTRTVKSVLSKLPAKLAKIVSAVATEVLNLNVRVRRVEVGAIQRIQRREGS